MNITDSIYSNVYMVSFNLDDLCDRGISVDKICITSGNNVILNTTRETLVAMRDKINELFPMEPDEIKALRDYLDTELERYRATRSKPEEPEPIEDGFYVTQDGVLIHRDRAYNAYPYVVYTSPVAEYSAWHAVVADLKPSAFPLTHVMVEGFRKLVRK